MTDELQYTVTFLELRLPSPSASRAPVPGFAIRRIVQPTLQQFRDLYDGVGAVHHWTDMHHWPAVSLAAVVQHPDVELYLVETVSGDPAGFFQLDFRCQSDGVVEILYFGLFPEFVGRGLGPWALSEAIQSSGRDGVRRVVVNTCTLDHPAARAMYERAGFVAVRHEHHTRTVDNSGWRGH